MCTFRGGDTLAIQFDFDLSQIEANVSVRDNLSGLFVAHLTNDRRGLMPVIVYLQRGS
jgi:hypothetical protein